MIECKDKIVTLDGDGRELMYELELIMLTLHENGVTLETLHSCVKYLKELRDIDLR